MSNKTESQQILSELKSIRMILFIILILIVLGTIITMAISCATTT